jgi:RimJ/RimL family protein N-acetyltransferase
MFEGLLVDLVPYGKKFMDQDHIWWNNDSVFWASMGDRGFSSQASVDREHKEWAESDKEESGVAFGVQAKDGTPLGYFGLNWTSYHDRTANLGASIGNPEYWGGGYGTDALTLLLDYAFYTLDLRKCWLVTMARNERVIRQMEKIGFTLEALHRKATYVDGDWVDVVSFALFRENWPGRAAVIEKLGLSARATT